MEESLINVLFYKGVGRKLNKESLGRGGISQCCPQSAGAIPRPTYEQRALENNPERERESGHDRVSQREPHRRKPGFTLLLPYFPPSFGASVSALHSLVYSTKDPTSEIHRDPSLPGQHVSGKTTHINLVAQIPLKTGREPWEMVFGINTTPQN